jgi:hypothetical protein
VSAAEPTKRLTLTDAYRDAQHVIDQLTTRAPSEPSASIEVTRNAAGNAQFSVKVFAPSSADEATVKSATGRAYDQAVESYDAVNVKYPHVDPRAAK